MDMRGDQTNIASALTQERSRQSLIYEKFPSPTDEFGGPCGDRTHDLRLKGSVRPLSGLPRRYATLCWLSSRHYCVLGSQIRFSRASRKPWFVGFNFQISTLLIVVGAPTVNASSPVFPA